MARNLKEYIGKAVRAARKRQGLTQQQLGDAIGRTAESISNLERGERLSFDALSAVASELKVTVSDLCEGFEPRRRATKDKLDLEFKLRETAKDLSPKNLKLAVALLKTLSDHESST